MRQIDFNDLPRLTRDRFVRALAVPASSGGPICRRASPPRRRGGWFVLFAFGLAVLGGLAYVRFGSIASPTQDRRLLAGYVGAWALLGLAGAMLARRRALEGSLPFAPGVYVFPFDVVDARTRHLELYSMLELQSIEPVHNKRGGRYVGSALWFVFPTRSFVFEVRGRARAEAELASVQSSRDLLSASLDRGGRRDLAAQDPFAEARERDFEPVQEHGLLARGRPAWTRFVWAITVIVGLVGGVGAWRARNWQSDEQAIRKLRASPDAALAEAYLRAGGQHADEVRRVIVPRARLIAAKSEAPATRAEALERFLLAHPGTSVDGDARLALAEALHAEYLTSSTIATLRTFLTRWPDAADAEAARRKIHELYATALADVRQHANGDDPSVRPAVEALLTWSAASASPVEVRFRRRDATTLAGADALLASGLLDDGGDAPGGRAPAARHFCGDADARCLAMDVRAPAVTRREAALVAGLARGLREVFPADAVALRVGPPVEPSSTHEKSHARDSASAPATLIVDYEIGWSGATYVTRDAKRRFLGLFVKLALTLEVPGAPHALAIHLTMASAESVTLDASASDAIVQALVPVPGGAAADDGRVYAAMFANVLDRVGPKLRAVVFDAQTAAARIDAPAAR